MRGWLETFQVSPCLHPPLEVNEDVLSFLLDDNRLASAESLAGWGGRRDYVIVRGRPPRELKEEALKRMQP